MNVFFLPVVSFQVAVSQYINGACKVRVTHAHSLVEHKPDQVTFTSTRRYRLMKVCMYNRFTTIVCSVTLKRKTLTNANTIFIFTINKALPVVKFGHVCPDKITEQCIRKQNNKGMDILVDMFN